MDAVEYCRDDPTWYIRQRCLVGVGCFCRGRFETDPYDDAYMRDAIHCTDAPAGTSHVSRETFRVWRTQYAPLP